MTADTRWNPRSGQRIERLYAWVAAEPDGGEGIVARHIEGFGWMPLVGADRARIESYRAIAEDIARDKGYPVRLKVFASGVVIDEIGR